MQSPDPHHADASDIDDTHPVLAQSTAHSADAGTPGQGGADADHDTGDAAYDLVSERAVPSAPTTGDPVVDAAMVELAAAESGTLTQRIDAGERAHRALQDRLSDLGGA